MISVYEQKREQFNIVHKVSKHYPPHLHANLEIVYVTEEHWNWGLGKISFIWKKEILQSYFQI